MAFRAYIASCDFSGDPSDDFIVDARIDKTMPDAGSWEELEEYLEQIHAMPAAIVSARKVWDRFTREAGRR